MFDDGGGIAIAMETSGTLSLPPHDPTSLKRVLKGSRWDSESIRGLVFMMTVLLLCWMEERGSFLHGGGGASTLMGGEGSDAILLLLWMVGELEAIVIDASQKRLDKESKMRPPSSLLSPTLRPLLTNKDHIIIIMRTVDPL